METKHTTENALKIFSGQCCLCDIGIPVNAYSTYGEPVELHTGDIILLWSGEYIGTESETWTVSDWLTAIVANQYQTFQDGSIRLKDEPFQPFPMGIAGAGFDSKSWRIQLVKKYSDVIEGERWPNFGFSYQKSPDADTARATLNREEG